MSTRQVPSLSGRSLVRAGRAAAHALSGVGFWLAVLAPFAYLPLLAVGLDTRPTQFAFAALFAVNVLALYVGRGYARERVADGAAWVADDD